MKKYFYFFVLAFTFSNIAIAQNNKIFKSFKVDIGFGMAQPFEKSHGLQVYIEPNYLFANRYRVGFKTENANFDMKNISSYTFTGDYFFIHNTDVGFFAGGGIGSFHSSASGGCDPGPSTVSTISRYKNWGSMLRAGIETGHLRLALEYNFVPTTYVSAVDADGKATSTVAYKNEYMGFQIGIGIGGGKKSKLKLTH